ncbi:hypothetical protein ACWM0J_01580 [Pediococcus acidilactici]
MSLLPELDEVKTIEKVKCFFEKEFPTLQNMAHTTFVDIKSPVISGMPVSHSADNGNGGYYYSVCSLVIKDVHYEVVRA